MTPIAEATIQAAILSAISNIVAQTLKSYNGAKPYVYDFTPLMHFVLFALIATPPNFLWQQQMEAWFPSQVPVVDAKSEKTDMKFSKSNTVKKFLTDQLLGGPVNTVLFLAAMGYFRGLTGGALLVYIQEEFWPLTLAGLKLWPTVSLISFSAVPAERRIVFGSLVALGWNVYLGLR
ncbi:hypothetical protein FN846DRAFT_141989 [Sphaerosporella brunnea]|uniref:Integral membrane protein, Mpv17/PMP22 family n=1 Tax=Sphaerosporella brunnea TaxID=1250544 RepID=A0A5J5EQT6_9PEZI|nr:hypothetical protein FN846DRAFT_141989 [Sphaerosporella brunnea]